jgi:hypothetical protein
MGLVLAFKHSMIAASKDLQKCVIAIPDPIIVRHYIQKLPLPNRLWLTAFEGVTCLSV